MRYFPFVTHKIYFKNRALSLSYPYGALTSCKNNRKTNGQSLRYSKTWGYRDGQRTKVITMDPDGSTQGPK